MSEKPQSPLRVGLVGAGPWASLMHAPMLSGGPETELVGVWARREEAARELAGKHAVASFSDYEELLEASEAIAFAVPPSVQPAMAMKAAERGRGLLLEKPLAAGLEEAERLAATVAEAGVGSLVAFSFHLCPAIADFLEAGRVTDLIGARASFVTAGAFGGPFATPWRLEGGTLIDLAPHLVEMLMTALGPVREVRAVHGAKEWWAAILEHDDGAVSEISISSHSRVRQRTEIQLFGPAGEFSIDAVVAMGPQYERFQEGALGVLGQVPAFEEMRRQLVRATRQGEHPLDVRRGIEVQRVVAALVADAESGAGGTTVSSAP